MRLVETRNCPVCGGMEREPSTGMARKRLQGLHYIEHAAAGLGISVEEYVDRVRTYRCLSCDSHFCDPWLSPELASALFCADAPDHIAGWSHFEDWMHPTPNLTQVRNERLYLAVTRRIGAVTSYAELGCPFQGFLLQLKGYEAAPKQRVDLFAKALDRPPDVRWRKIVRIYHTAQRWCGRLAVLGFRARRFLRSAAGVKPKDLSQSTTSHSLSKAAMPLSFLPQHRCLLTQDTINGWGSNCVRYGVSCKYVAHRVLDADVIPLVEAQQNNFAFDLIGIFNSLDHIMSPLELLRTCLELTDHVLIVTHHATHAGKQHLFAFGEGFADWLNTSLKDVSAEDLGDEVDGEGCREYNCIFISRNR